METSDSGSDFGWNFHIEFMSLHKFFRYNAQMTLIG